MNTRVHMDEVLTATDCIVDVSTDRLDIVSDLVVGLGPRVVGDRVYRDLANHRQPDPTHGVESIVGCCQHSHCGEIYGIA